MGFADILLAQAPQGTARYTVDTILLGAAKPPVFVGRHAGESNPGFWSDSLKVANLARSRSGGGALTQSKIDEQRERTAKLYAKHVMTAWEHVCEEPGIPSPCTPDVVERCLLALAASRPDAFTALTNYFADADNFRDVAPEPVKQTGNG